MARVRTSNFLARLGLALSLFFGHVSANAADAGATPASPVASAAAAAALQPTLYDVTVNGQAAPEPAEFLRDHAGRLFLSQAFLHSWRIRLPATGAMTYEGQTYYPASALPSLRLNITEQTQAVAIVADASAFEAQASALNGLDLMEMTPPSNGVFLNYDVFAEKIRGRTLAAGAFDTGIFTRHGAGTASFLASAGGGRTRITRLETTWTIDRPDHLSSIRIGDSVSFAGPGAAPVRFAGAQYARNFAVQPGYITMPLPVASGSAAVPSVVDVYVNSTLQGEQQVTPGPFQLSNIPVPSGGGTVQLVVRDILGREVVSEQAYYASTLLLRKGLHDFSYEAGFLREGFGIKSNRYGSFFASTTHRYGITDRLTAEATAQASERRQMAGVALTAVAFDLGQVGGSVAVSHQQDRGWGYRAAASFERRTHGLSFGVLSDYTSVSYTTLGLRDDRPPPRYTVQAFADVPIGRGSAGVNFLYRSMRDAPSETLIGAFANWRLTRSMSLQVYARRAVLSTHQTSFGFHLSMALGGTRSASASVEHDRSGTNGYVSYQQDPPAGPGGGFRVVARAGDNQGGEAAYVQNLPMAQLRAEASYSGGDAGVRLSASGSIGWLDNHAFAARTLGESFAAVRLDGYQGVRVYADNQQIGVTDKNGFLIVPGLHAFQRNTIRIEQADLPLNATLTAEELAIRPFARAGTALRFNIARERGALLSVALEDGSPLPAGARISIDGRPPSAVAVSGGEIYLPEVSGTINVEAAWAAGTCGFTAAIPNNDDPQPRISGLVCRARSHYAAR
jgi:outer membrane usher protein